MNDKELKPCPFCGGKAVITRFSTKSNRFTKIQIECDNEECDFKPKYKRKLPSSNNAPAHEIQIDVYTKIVIEAWNRRANHE